MRFLLALTPLLALILSSCGRSDPAPLPTRKAPPGKASSGVDPTAPVSGLGSETDGAEQADYGKWKVNADTHLCIKTHAINTFIRDRTPEEEREFERLVGTGKLRPVSAGSIVKKISGRRTYKIGDKTVYLVRVELTDDPTVHGLMLEESLSKMN